MATEKFAMASLLSLPLLLPLLLLLPLTRPLRRSWGRV
jgi:hypothetical protein